jgi:hypothetical protein
MNAHQLGLEGPEVLKKNYSVKKYSGRWRIPAGVTVVALQEGYNK